MAEDGDIKFSTHAYKLKVFCLPITTLLKDLKLKHELLCGDLYVAFELTGFLNFWDEPQDWDEFGLKPDRRMIYDGKIVFWEVDRGTEDYYTDKGIKGKLDRYTKLSRSRPDRFHVCFTTIDNKTNAERRAETILELINSYKRGDQFMITLHKWAVEMPDLASFLTFTSPMGTSIKGAT
ncbi:hypothetical protein BH10ACI1_BH10ACI1_02710 [soil metagenome]